MPDLIITMDYVTILGFFAGALTTMAFVPQVTKIWKSRSTKDISLGMYSAFVLGVFLWFLYGLFIKSYPVIIVNVVTFVLALIILIFKIRYK